MAFGINGGSSSIDRHRDELRDMERARRAAAERAGREEGGNDGAAPPDPLNARGLGANFSPEAMETTTHRYARRCEHGLGLLGSAVSAGMALLNNSSSPTAARIREVAGEMSEVMRPFAHELKGMLGKVIENEKQKMNAPGFQEEYSLKQELRQQKRVEKLSAAMGMSKYRTKMAQTMVNVWSDFGDFCKYLR